MLHEIKPLTLSVSKTGFRNGKSIAARRRSHEDQIPIPISVPNLWSGNQSSPAKLHALKKDGRENPAICELYLVCRNETKNRFEADLKKRSLAQGQGGANIKPEEYTGYFEDSTWGLHSVLI